MRTTVTLDSDVERMLKDEAYRRGKSFKSALNEAVRRAFLIKRPGASKGKPFVVKARPMGLRADIDPSRLNELSDKMEIEAFLLTTKKARKNIR